MINAVGVVAAIDHKSDTSPGGTLSPSYSTADSNDGLPISEDSWSLLREFEDFSNQEKAAPLHNCDMINSDLGLGEMSDDLDLNEFLPFDLMLPENEFNLNGDGFIQSTSLVDTEPVTPDAATLTHDQISPETSTSNLLAELISQTFMAPSLEGLLSSTTLDISTVSIFSVFVTLVLMTI